MTFHVRLLTAELPTSRKASSHLRGEDIYIRLLHLIHFAPVLHFTLPFRSELADFSAGPELMENVAPMMSPAPGERLLRFVGDRVRFTLKDASGPRRKGGARGCARISAAPMFCAGKSSRPTPPVCRWPERRGAICRCARMATVGRWNCRWRKSVFSNQKRTCSMTRAGNIGRRGRTSGISVHPNDYRTANTIYCAFTAFVRADAKFA